MAGIYKKDDILNITQNSQVQIELQEEVRKCVPYAWILINHYRIRNYIKNKKITRKELNTTQYPFFVEILDIRHPHVRGQEIKINGSRKPVYKKIYAEKGFRKNVLFIDRNICGYTLNDIQTFIFNKNCKKNLEVRLLSDVGRTEDKSSKIIKDLSNDRSASVIKNNEDIDLVVNEVYAETVFRATYAGKDINKVEWYYPYPRNDDELEKLKLDAVELIKSMKIKVVEYIGHINEDEISDEFKNRF